MGRMHLEHEEKYLKELAGQILWGETVSWWIIKPKLEKMKES